MLSLASCKQCIVMDDQFNILPISSNSSNIVPVAAAVKVINDSNLDILFLPFTLETAITESCIFVLFRKVRLLKNKS